MSALLTDALRDTRDPEPHDVIATGLARIASTVSRRIRARRRRLVAEWLAVAAVLAVVVTGPSWWASESVSGARSAPDGATVSTTTRDGAWVAPGLLATTSPRERGDESPAQAAVVCDAATPAAGDGLTACDAAWVGDAALIELSPVLTSATAQVWEDAARVTVRWVVANVSDRPLSLDRVSGGATLVTHPDAIAVSYPDLAATTSLWTSESTRVTSLHGAISRGTVRPGQLFTGETTFTASAPRAGEAGDALWRIATGETDATVTVQVRVAPGEPREAVALLLEDTVPLELKDVVTAERLAETFTSRAQGDPTPQGTQAAMLCDVPPELRPGARGTSVAFASEPVECEPGWVDGPVLVAESGLTFDGRGVSTRALWSLSNRSGSVVDYSRVMLLLEGVPDRTRPEDADLALLGSVVAAPHTAWLEDGSRLMWLDNARAAGSIAPDATLDKVDRLFPAIRWIDRPVNARALVASLHSGGAATALVVIPFLDHSRAVVLEVPIPLALSR